MFEPLQEQSGYQLVDLGQNLWQIKSPDKTYVGSLRQVVKYSVINFGFSVEELEIGVIEMEKRFHNASQFGVFKRFMWTYDLEEAETTVCH